MHPQSFIMEADNDRRAEIGDSLNTFLTYLYRERPGEPLPAISTLIAALVVKVADLLAALPSSSTGEGRKELVGAVERDLTMLLALMKAPEQGNVLVLPGDEVTVQ